MCIRDSLGSESGASIVLSMDLLSKSTLNQTLVVHYCHNPSTDHQVYMTYDIS